MPRALRENNRVTAVSLVVISSIPVLLGRVVTTAMLSLEGKLMVMSLVWFGLYQLQRVIVPKRRCSGHWFVKYAAMAAYYLPSTLGFSCARALYYSTSHINQSTPQLLGGILVMLFATKYASSSQFGLLYTNMRAYSLQQRPEDCSSFLMWLWSLFSVEWELAPIPSSTSNWLQFFSEITSWLVTLLFHFYVAFLILFGNTAESTLDCQTKEVADYMEQESRESSSPSPFFDDDAAPNSNSSLQLDFCRYPFTQRKDGAWFSIKDLVHQCPDLQDEDKDICLSYSFSQLLARLYYEFPCAEEGDDMVRRFVLDQFEAIGYKRAFTIVEVQLAFLHDYFFTSFLPIIQSGLLHYNRDVMMLPIIFFMAIMSFAAVIPQLYGLLQLVLVVVMSIFWLRCALIGFRVQDVLAFYWLPIHTAFHKLNCLPGAFDPFQTKTGGAYWRNKIGQYSILQDYNRPPSSVQKMKASAVAWFQKTLLSQPSYKFIKHLPVEEEEVYVHKQQQEGRVRKFVSSLLRKKEVDTLEMDSMRKLIAYTLQGIDGPPTNGTRSLKDNMEEIMMATSNRDNANYDWLLAWKQKTHTDTILIWHIATCYCDMTPISDAQSVKFHHEAARALSRYCAYLVAFLPEFLPVHSLTTKQVFQRVMQEAQSALGTEPIEEEEKRTKIQGLRLPDWRDQWTTFHEGVHLGRQLQMLNDYDDNDEGVQLGWKVMAEFWAETILYVAPSNKAEAHIEQLAKGGEFITHLWAMLSNAGILKRAEGERQAATARGTTNAPTPGNNDGPSTSSRHSQLITCTGEQSEIMEDID